MHSMVGNNFCIIEKILSSKYAAIEYILKKSDFLNAQYGRK